MNPFVKLVAIVVKKVALTQNTMCTGAHLGDHERGLGVPVLVELQHLLERIRTDDVGVQHEERHGGVRLKQATCVTSYIEAQNWLKARVVIVASSQ